MNNRLACRARVAELTVLKTCMPDPAVASDQYKAQYHLMISHVKSLDVKNQY